MCLLLPFSDFTICTGLTSDISHMYVTFPLDISRMYAIVPIGTHVCLRKYFTLRLPHGNHSVFLHSCLVVQSYSSTSKSVLVSQYLFSELSSFQSYLSSMFHFLFLPFCMKHFSLSVSLNSSNPGTCVQTHCSCNISWCDNVQQCVRQDYISNNLRSY
jgi:hypothetical protein